MRFVLEEDNALVLRNKDGIEIQRQENIIPEDHSLVLASEDLSYITYGRRGFSYKRYNPESLAIEEEYGIPTGASQSDYENSFPMAAYCPTKKKAFFITISKPTREIRVYENDNPGSKTVEEKLPKNTINNWAQINLKNVSFHSSYFGEGKKKYTVFLSGEDNKGYWQFAIDIFKNNSDAPELVTLNAEPAKVKICRMFSAQPVLFGQGINPSSISSGKGGNVHISTPDDGEGREVKNDSLSLYRVRYFGEGIAILLLFGVPGALLTGWMLGFLLDLLTPVVPQLSPEHFFWLLLVFFFGISILAIRRGKTAQRIALLFGGGIRRYYTRIDKTYNSKLRKVGDLLDSYQTSPSTIALLHKNKIQFYDFRTHQILQQRTVQGNFNQFLLLKQRASFQTHRCEYLVIYKINDGSIQFKICNLESNELSLIADISIDAESDVSLKAVLIDGKYQDDAHLPFVLNTRVEIDHTTNPMQLTITHKGPDSGVVEFYNSLRNSPQVWSNIKRISNLTELVDSPNEKEVVFELSSERSEVALSDGFDLFSQSNDETKSETNNKLRWIKGGTEIVPNLETAIFLQGDIHSPATTFIRHFSKSFPALLKDFWTCGMDSEIFQETESFGFEDDLPALAYMADELEEFKKCNPKQNTELWKDCGDLLPPEQVNRIIQNIKKESSWPRTGYVHHHSMHGDLTPANVIVNTGNWEVEDFGGGNTWDVERFKLLLCDFSDLVARDEKGNVIYRTETEKTSEEMRSRASSQFFDTPRVPKINPMLDLAKFLAHLLLKVPFEPYMRDELNEIKYHLRNNARRLRQKNGKEVVYEEWRKELEKALGWAVEQLSEFCYLAEEGMKDEDWRNLLKAMVFDQCLQIMMFWKRNRSDLAIENDITTEDLCWIFYRVDEITPENYAPTFLQRADNIMRRDASGDQIVYLSAAENRSRNNTRMRADHVYPMRRKQTKIHHQSGSFYDWAKNLLDVYNESHFLEHDVVDEGEEGLLRPPFTRILFTQNAKDILDEEEKLNIYEPLIQCLTNPDLIRQSSKLEFDGLWGDNKLYKSRLDQSSRVFFAVYDHEDDVVLHVIGIYIVEN
tara:strand:+ start:3151 stop:6393 length:3243 start_codon:yes stop_codon:yes gene_type:complete